MSPAPDKNPGVLAQDRAKLEELATASIRAGRLDDAERTLRSLLDAWPGTPNYWLELAAVLERKGMRGDALACYRDLIERQPDFAVARFNYACFLRRDGQLEEALRQHQRALDLKIDQPEEVLSNMGVIHGELHHHEDARNFLQRALTVNANYIPAMYNLALLREEFGDREGAIGLFNRILALDPSYYNALVRIVHARTLSDPADPAIKKLRRSLRLTNMDALTRENLHFALGKALDDCSLYDEAFEQFRLGNRCSVARMPPYDRNAAERGVAQIVETFTSQWLARAEPVSDRPLIFVTGMFRSGSTLFEQVLAAHPRVAPGGEIDYFGRLLMQARATSSQRDAGNPGAPATTGLTALFAEPVGDSWRGLGNGYLEYLDKTFPAGSLVTNKRPDAFALLGMFRGLFPNARFVNTVRDPLDTCLSIYFHQLDSQFAYANDLENIAHYSLQYRRLMDHWKQLFGASIFDAAYDEYVVDREPTTRALLRFLDLDWSDACLEPQRSRSRVRTDSVWQVREPVYRKSSGRWRNYARHFEPARRILGGG